MVFPDNKIAALSLPAGFTTTQLVANDYEGYALDYMVSHVDGFPHASLK